MNVVFRVDSSILIGSGHVVRCLTLAQALKKNGANVKFICRKHKGNLIHKVRLSGFSVYGLEALSTNIEFDNELTHSNWLGVTQEKDASDCVDILKIQKSSWIIVDHYSINEQWQKRLRPYCDRLMVIDDLADRKHCCDLLLDQSFGRNEKEYFGLVPKKCNILVGAQYALLRPEFARWRGYSLSRRRKVELKQLLINMGGVDSNNVTEKILEKLKICNLLDDLHIVIVMGGASPNIQKVKAKIATLPFKVEIKVDVDNMAEIMANSDIAIGASGSTTWERCCLGIPTIQLIIAHNQEFVAQQLSKINAIRLVELDDLVENLENFQYWMREVSENAKNITNGDGTKSVLEHLL